VVVKKLSQCCSFLFTYYFNYSNWLYIFNYSGDYFACRLAFVPYLVMDKKLDPIKAVEESWRLTRGYGWRIFGMALLAIPIAILGLVMLVVGIIPAIIWITAAFAGMYHAVMLERGEYQKDNIEEVSA
jgi:uncharacterized membrane protein